METPLPPRNGALLGMRKPAILVLLGTLAALSGIAATVHAAPGDELYARPGQLVAAQGTRLNFYCMGSGSPAVVFDSGWEDWAPVWAIVQPQVVACSRPDTTASTGSIRRDQELFTDKSSEYIPFDQPDFVIDAIHEVFAQSQ